MCFTNIEVVFTSNIVLKGHVTYKVIICDSRYGGLLLFFGCLFVAKIADIPTKVECHSFAKV